MPSPVVTITQAAQALRIKAKRISGWVERGYLKPIARKGKSPYSAHLFQLEAVKAVALKLAGGAFWFQAPAGYLTTTEAGRVMNRSGQRVAVLFHKGEVKGKVLRASMCGGRGRIFVLKSSAEEWARRDRESRQTKYVTVNDNTPKNKPRERAVTNPLISPYDAECLAARRRLFEERGRRWPRWMRNSI